MIFKYHNNNIIKKRVNILMKCIFSYADLNLSHLEEKTRKELANGKYNNYFSEPDITLAAIFGDLDKIKYLLSKNDFQIDEQDKYGNTALWNACLFFGRTHNNYKLIKLLLDNNANVNHKCGALKQSPLFVMLGSYLFHNLKNQNNKIQLIYTINILLKYGANINDQDLGGNTILILAVEYHKIDLINILLNENINIRVKNNYEESAIDKINKIFFPFLSHQAQIKAKKKIFDVLTKYKYNSAVFYLFTEYDINIIFNN